MSDKTGIEWTDATSIVDREGRRVRIYHRIDKTRPGQQLRRQMAAAGKKWCRKCAAWLASESVSKNGLCREHERQQYRDNYASNPDQIRRRVHARKRGVAPIPKDADMVAELFGNKCAYCGGQHETWDHVVAVSTGGKSEAGNIVPACRSCNSSKKAKPLADWINSGGQITEYMAEYMIGIHQGI